MHALLACVVGASFLIGGCRLQHPLPSPDAPPPQAGDVLMVRTELYFGLSQKRGGEISPEQFDAFVAEVITPRFPDGLTIVDGTGQWREPNGQIEHEKSKILIVLHKPEDKAANAIDEIRAQFKSQFGEESVMRVSSTAGVAF